MTNENYQTYKTCMVCKKSEVPKEALEILVGEELVGFPRLSSVILTDNEQRILRAKGYQASHGVLSKECMKQQAEHYARDLGTKVRTEFIEKMLEEQEGAIAQPIELTVDERTIIAKNGYPANTGVKALFKRQVEQYARELEAYVKNRFVTRLTSSESFGKSDHSCKERHYINA